MHGWLTTHAREIVAALLAVVFASEIFYVATRNTLGPWWSVWIAPPKSGLSKRGRWGWYFWNGVCISLCLIVVAK